VCVSCHAHTQTMSLHGVWFSVTSAERCGCKALYPLHLTADLWVWCQADPGCRSIMLTASLTFVYRANVAFVVDFVVIIAVFARDAFFLLDHHCWRRSAPLQLKVCVPAGWRSACGRSLRHKEAMHVRSVQIIILWPGSGTVVHPTVVVGVTCWRHTPTPRLWCVFLSDSRTAKRIFFRPGNSSTRKPSPQPRERRNEQKSCRYVAR